MRSHCSITEQVSQVETCLPWPALSIWRAEVLTYKDLMQIYSVEALVWVSVGFPRTGLYANN